MEHRAAWIWAWVAQPLLFGIVGTAANFRKIKPATIPLSVVSILSGACLALTFLAQARLAHASFHATACLLNLLACALKDFNVHPAPSSLTFRGSSCTSSIPAAMALTLCGVLLG